MISSRTIGSSGTGSGGSSGVEENSIVSLSSLTKVEIYAHLPQTNLVADGSTIYQLEVRGDTTAFPSKMFISSSWDVVVPNYITIVSAELPSSDNPSTNTNDFYYDHLMREDNNKVDSTVYGGELEDNSRMTEDTYVGPSNVQNKLLGKYNFKVNSDAPIGNGYFNLNNVLFLDEDLIRYEPTRSNLLISKDTFTISVPDTTPPEISVATPVMGFNYDSLPILINVNTSEITNAWYHLKNSLGETIENEVLNTTDGINFIGQIESIVPDTYNLTIYATDLSGNNNSKTLEFVFDNEAPNIVLGIISDVHYTKLPLVVGVSIYDAFPFDAWYTLDSGITNKTINGIDEINENELEDGNYLLEVYAMDTTGNRGYKSLNVVVDTILPAVNYSAHTPENNAIIYGGDFGIAVQVEEENMENIKYILYKDEQVLDEDVFYGEIYEINYTGLELGDYSFEVVVTDKASNQNVSERREISLEPALSYVPVTGCMNINSGGEYRLMNDISGIEGFCITISAENEEVIFDGNGFTISGDLIEGESGQDYGIKAENVGNIIIKNVIIEGFDYGLWIKDAQNGIIRDVDLSAKSGQMVSLKLQGSGNINIEGNVNIEDNFVIG